MPESHSIIALFKWMWSVSMFKNISHALYGISEVVQMVTVCFECGHTQNH